MNDKLYHTFFCLLKKTRMHNIHIIITLLFVLYNLETQTSAHETSSDVKLLNKTISSIIFILTKFNHEAVNLDFIYMNSIVVWVKYSNLNAYYLNLPYQI